MANDKIPYLSTAGVSILWEQMKKYYADVLRGDGSQLETSAKTVVEAINEIYSLINTPKITSLEILGESEITSAGKHEFTAACSPEANTFLFWGISSVGQTNKAVPTSVTINHISGELNIIEGTNGSLEIFVFDTISGKVATKLLTINTTVRAESLDIIGEDILRTLGGTYNYSVNPNPKDASVNLTWSLEDAPSGWSIDSETGKLSVDYDAEFYEKQVNVMATDSISSKSVRMKLSMDNVLSVIFPNTLKSIPSRWYNNGVSAPKSYVAALSIPESVSEIEANGLADFSEVDLVVPPSIITFGEGSLSGLGSVQATSENYLAVKEANPDATLIGSAESISIIGLASKYTHAETIKLSISKTPENAIVDILWSVEGDGAEIDPKTGDLTIKKGFHNSEVTVIAKDLFTEKTTRKTITLDTVDYLKSFVITGPNIIGEAGSFEYHVDDLNPELSLTSFDWTCNLAEITLTKKADNVILTVPKGILNKNVILTATDSFSKISKSITINIDSRVTLTNLKISGPTTIGAAGGYTYKVTYTDPIPSTYHDITISCQCESRQVSISSKGVLTVGSMIQTTAIIIVEDSYSGRRDSIEVDIDTTASLVLTYKFANDEPGNADGTIELSTTKAGDYGNYDIYYGNSNGEILNDYLAINYVDSYTNTADKDNIPLTLSGSNPKASFSHFIGANAIPLSAKTIVACIEGTKDIVATYAIPESKLTSHLEFGVKRYSIGMISDIHIDGLTDTDSNDGNADLKRSIKWFKDYNVKAICSAGDVTDDGENNQWQSVQNIITENNLRTAIQNTSQTSYIPFYISAGNHDARKISTFKQYTGYDTYNVQTIGGDVYIFCGLNNAYDNILGENYSKLATDLERYKDKSRVFVFQHVPIPATNGNAEKIYAYNAWTNNSNNPYETNTYSNQFADLMKQYDNVILINGHSHLKMWNQVFDPNANYYRFTEGGARMLHLPSLTYPREWKWDYGTGNYTTATNDDRRYNDISSSEACVLDVYENGVIFRSFNCQQQKFIGIAEYMMETNAKSVDPDIPQEPEEPETPPIESEDAKVIFHFNKELTPAGASGGYTNTESEGWYIDSEGTKKTDLVVKPASENNWVHKFVDASLMSQENPTGSMRTISDWTLLAEVTKTSSTSTSSSGYQRAICDSPVNYNGGFNIDYYPGTGFVVNVMQACPIGANTGTAVFTDDEDSKASYAINVDSVKIAVKRSGETYQYSLDGIDWIKATNRIQDNASNKSFTIGGTGGSGSHPFYGKVKCDVYDTYTLDQTIINSFFGAESIEATSFTLNGQDTIVKSGKYSYRGVPTPAGATMRLSWEVSGTSNCTISNSGVLNVPNISSGIFETITITATDLITSKKATITVTIDVPEKDPSGIPTDLLMYVDRVYTAGSTDYTDAELGKKVANTGWWMNEGQAVSTLAKVTGTGKPYQDKLPLMSIASTTGTTNTTLNKPTDVTASGTVTTLDKWMMLVFAKPGETGNNSVDGDNYSYGRAVCDIPNLLTQGIAIDAYGSGGMTANIYKNFIIGTTIGYPDTSVSEAKLAIRRDGETVEYTLDGKTWNSVTPNFYDNAGKVLSLAGSNSGNNPYTGYLHLELYEDFSDDACDEFFLSHYPLDETEQEPPVLIENFTVNGQESITEAGRYTYTPIITPKDAISRFSWKIVGESVCTLSQGGVLVVPSRSSGLKESFDIVVTEGYSKKDYTLSITISIPASENPQEPEEPEITTEDLVFYVDREYTKTGLTAGYSTGVGYYIDASGERQDTLKATTGKYSDKFDTSLIGSKAGNYRYLEDWTMLALVEHTPETPITASDNKYTRALCDTPNNYAGGINIDYYPGIGWIVNVMSSCVIGKDTTFTGSNEPAYSSAVAVDGNKVKLLVKKHGTTVEYSIDSGGTWKTATNNFQNNAGKVLTLGGTNSVNNPYYGHVKCAVYETYDLNQTTIANFFNETIEELSKISVSGKDEITTAGTYTYVVTKYPSNSVANIEWTLSADSGCTITNKGELVVPKGIEEKDITITATDKTTKISDFITIKVNTVVIAGSNEPIWQVSTEDGDKTSEYAIAAATSDPITWTLCVDMSIDVNSRSADCGLKCGENFSALTSSWSTTFIYTKVFGVDIYNLQYLCTEISNVKFVVTRENNAVKYRKSTDTNWTTIPNPSFGNGNLEFIKGSLAYQNINIKLYDHVLEDTELIDFLS